MQVQLVFIVRHHPSAAHGSHPELVVAWHKCYDVKFRLEQQECIPAVCAWARAGRGMVRRQQHAECGSDSSREVGGCASSKTWRCVDYFQGPLIYSVSAAGIAIAPIAWHQHMLQRMGVGHWYVRLWESGQQNVKREQP
jgi:hypothetical protein